MSDYSHFPPLQKFYRVLRSCPQAALLYISLWTFSNGDPCSFARDRIKPKFLVSPTLFRNHLLALGRAGILTFDETTDYFNIKFIAYD